MPIPGATFLLNSPYGPDEVWDKLPRSVQQQIIDKKMRFYVIDGYKVAKETGMGARVNTIMQTCFFAISGVLPARRSHRRDQGLDQEDIRRARARRSSGRTIGPWIETLANLFEVKMPGTGDQLRRTAAGRLAGSAGVRPATSPPRSSPAWETRCRSARSPSTGLSRPGPASGRSATSPSKSRPGIPEICIQCGKCALVCPHATIRIKAYDEKLVESAPPTFKWMKAKGPEFLPGMAYTVQVAPEDCTGCGVVRRCLPGQEQEGNPTQGHQHGARSSRSATQERENYKFFLDLPEYDRRQVKMNSIKANQLLQPLFEYSGACAGCGETPYVKLMTQLFGDRAIVANATGCSSIYGGNLPTTPWTYNKEGRGPSW